MKRYLLACLMAIIFVSGCASEDIERAGASTECQEVNQGQEAQMQSEAQSDTAEMAADVGSSPKEQESVEKTEEIHKYQPDLTKIGNWVPYLNENGQLTVDVNGDGINDLFRIEYVDKEGGIYIALFEFALGEGGQFTISESSSPLEDYDAQLEAIELLDFNGDGTEELILMFNTHGAGGCGTHEIFVLWPDEENRITSQKIDSYVELSEDNQIQTSEDTYFDMIYRIQKIVYEGKERLMTYQSMWEGTHSNGTGDLVSIVTLDRDSNMFKAEQAWLALEQPMW